MLRAILLPVEDTTETGKTLLNAFEKATGPGDVYAGKISIEGIEYGIGICKPQGKEELILIVRKQ